LPSTKAGSSERASMGSVVTTIFFAEVDTYYDGAKDTQGAHRRTSSSTMMVAGAGAPDSTPRGPTVERLHRLRWWPLPELPAAHPGGPPSNVFVDYDGGHCQSSRQHTQGARRRTSSSTTMVAAAGALGSTPRGPAVDVFIDYVGGAIGAPGSITRGPAIDVWLKTWYLSPAFLLCDTYQGATMANTTTTDRTKFRRKIFLEKD
jgi:hypothetical protein